MLNLLFQLKQHNVISDGDYYFAKLIADKQLASAYPEHVQNLAVLLAALCSHSYQQGNTCLYLDDSLIHNLFGLAYRGLADERNYLSEIQRKIDYLSISEWQRILEQHIAFTVQPLTDMRPLVFQHGALYFYRVWQDEFRVANYLKSAVEKSRVLTPEWTNEQIKTVLNSYFDEPKEYINWQKIAVATALRQPFCLISGGPGTGKTYTVARLLTVIQQLRFMCNQPPLQIALAAPTGKAAARLTESIGNALNDMSLSAELIPFVPTESVTLHRLLGMRLFDERSKFNAHNPLPVDLLVVDEASMVDLSMLAKLLQALKPQTKLILLGDKDQLASVEAGAVIGELGQFMRQDYSPDLVSYLTATTNENLLSSVQGNPIRD
ncbi:MAG TPA: exodeoxyribonuclease V subunit alpha, partial [Pasteurellaceae bacterium]|nr:exodeoxyribonuclease V subunit alpha [Pasteurellaceae bacterium]